MIPLTIGNKAFLKEQGQEHKIEVLSGSPRDVSKRRCLIDRVLFYVFNFENTFVEQKDKDHFSKRMQFCYSPNIVVEGQDDP